ncbi:MAG TPA: tripartite tricarboxylate transporter substrate binding protein [Alphaproteobacteria bacterium]|nr:tripartite tricarboxylate transporter substrate binding protein [Alphaproteobacteria bacterium]
MTFAKFAAGAAWAVVWSAAAGAQTYPAKPIHMLVPYAPGGIVDTTARLVQNGMQAALGGQTVVVDNRSGAAGEIASEIVAHAAPDGYTLLCDNESHAINPAIVPKLPYDTEKDFAAVSQISAVTRIFVVNVETPAKTLKEFVTLAKASPGKYNYANAAAGVQLGMELFDNMAGIKVTMVAYRGGAPSMQAMISNETQITLVPLVPALSFIQQGKLRALAVAAGRREPQLPDVPTVAEAGYPEFQAPSWVGIFAPAGTPQAIIDKLHAAVAAALKSPDLLKRFGELGMNPAPTPGPEFAKSVSADIARWTKVARDNNIVVQN